MLEFKVLEDLSYSVYDLDLCQEPALRLIFPKKYVPGGTRPSPAKIQTENVL